MRVDVTDDRTTADSRRAGRGEQSRRDTLEYRPHLDGIRTLAVYLVVAFHAGVEPLRGGFIGVDVFFVLSGYLVTQLLVRDLLEDGRVRLGYFYARRVRRLLPAAVVTLLATMFVFAAISTPAQLVDAVGSVRSAFLYVANWFFIRQSNDYFATGINSSPVVHFWSLAIEEQFYICWPLLLTALFVASRRRDKQWTIIRAVVCACAAASLAAALLISRSDLNRAYYGTDTRAYELLAGALLALSLQARARRELSRAWLVLLQVVALFVLLGAATSLVHLGPVQRGVTATLSTSVLLATLDAHRGSIVGRAFSLPVVTYLGRISYGTYLWHWLVIVVAVHAFDPGPWSLLAISATVATSVASLSFQVLERPIRVSATLDRHRFPAVALGLALSIVCAVAIVPTILDRRSSASAQHAVALTGGTPVPAGLDWQTASRARPPRLTCFNVPAARCIVTHGSGPRVVLMGDSHASMFSAAITDVARRDHWTFAPLIDDACPWQDGLYRFTGYMRSLCSRAKAHWLGVITALRPQIVIFAEAPLDQPGVKGLDLSGPSGPLASGSPAAVRAIDAATDETVARLRRAGIDVVIIEPIPQAPKDHDPLACISGARFVEQCRFVATQRPSAIEAHYRELARRDPRHVWSLDVDRLACPYLPICDELIGGRIVWADVSHLTLAYAATLAPSFRALFAANRIGTS